MTVMFEPVETLNRKLPRPKLTGEPEHDRQVRDLYIDHARVMRSEAFACMARSVVKAVRNGWHNLTMPILPSRSHQA